MYPLLLLALVSRVSSDIYFHNPRGSNNRLDENTAVRKNGNRLFDSQNNNRGGYNVGDLGSTPANGKEDSQYQMRYFQSSGRAPTELELEWTMQHGCGHSSADFSEVNCQVVIQYMCQDPSQVKEPTQRLRDGISTASQGFKANSKGNIEIESEAQAREKADVAADRGIHENWQWYDDCNRRIRNLGLFTADVDLCQGGSGDKCLRSATSTRQNPTGGRSGYECPEERDYYPYWHPTPWKDIAILTTCSKKCKSISAESFNVKPRHLCVEFYADKNRKHWSRWNNRKDCESNGGSWTALYNYLEKANKFKDAQSCVRQSIGEGSDARKYIWGLAYDGNGRTPECLVPLPLPKCKSAPWTRPNHLGNGLDGKMSHYTWKLPYFPSGKNYSCVARIRYNISTWDYDPVTTDWKSNTNKTTGVVSPIRNNPLINYGGVVPLRLTINTKQTGRTFQDRSHMFWLIPRPPVVQTLRILNLNVRGKRGNIVQVYPAVEYDFVPNYLEMFSDDLLHIQWTGSNTHNNNGNGGDGDAGAAGQGAAGTDRHNFLPLDRLDENYPSPFWKSSFWKNVKVAWSLARNNTLQHVDLALELVSSGYYRCLNESSCPDVDKKHVLSSNEEKLNPLLDNAPASYPGVVIRVGKGLYYYMCTRNNNFSNRSQKGMIYVQ